MEFLVTVKCHYKWKTLRSANDFTGGVSKRSKTSSTTHSFSSNAHTDIDLNNAQQYEGPVQHMGRDRAKRKLKGVAGSSSGTNVDQVMEKLSMYILPSKPFHK
ncbi:hypothetical protein LXL04_006799 [Taraxacum kok-saghyz]